MVKTEVKLYQTVANPYLRQFSDYCLAKLLKNMNYQTI